MTALSRVSQEWSETTPRNCDSIFAAAIKGSRTTDADYLKLLSDAATLYAESAMNLNPWKLWTPDGKPAEGTEEIVATLESVLKRDPNHIGANHYYIHAVEASLHPERALPSAAMTSASVFQSFVLSSFVKS